MKKFKVLNYFPGSFRNPQAVVQINFFTAQSCDRMNCGGFLLLQLLVVSEMCS